MCATGTLPLRKPLSCTWSLNSSRRVVKRSVSSPWPMTTFSSRLRPVTDDSVTCMISASTAASGGTDPAPLAEPTYPSPSASMVRAEGLEPPRLASQEPKSCASASSATPAGSNVSRCLALAAVAAKIRDRSRPRPRRQPGSRSRLVSGWGGISSDVGVTSGVRPTGSDTVCRRRHGWRRRCRPGGSGTSQAKARHEAGLPNRMRAAAGQRGRTVTSCSAAGSAAAEGEAQADLELVRGEVVDAHLGVGEAAGCR